MFIQKILPDFNNNKQLQKSNVNFKTAQLSEVEKLTKEISKVRSEITLQEKAYDKYMSAANAVGLSSKWKKRVRDGSINISTIKDETLAEKIKSYQDYYNKVLDCEDAIRELQETEASLYAQRFENIQTQHLEFPFLLIVVPTLHKELFPHLSFLHLGLDRWLFKQNPAYRPVSHLKKQPFGCFCVV